MLFDNSVSSCGITLMLDWQEKSVCFVFYHPRVWCVVVSKELFPSFPYPPPLPYAVLLLCMAAFDICIKETSEASDPSSCSLFKTRVQLPTCRAFTVKVLFRQGWVLLLVFTRVSCLIGHANHLSSELILGIFVQSFSSVYHWTAMLQDRVWIL